MKIRYIFEIIIVGVAIAGCIRPSFKDGFREGVEQGFNDGFKKGWVPYAVMSTHFEEARKTYGNLHNTPWGFFTIEEKMLLCGYGSSGNKLRNEDMREISKKYWRME